MYKILIIDDERLARVELKRLLREHADVNITGEAKNAVEALSLMESNEFDLVFLDIHMPEMDGMELAAELNPSTPFVFCTAYNEHAVDAFSLNAFDYIVKPVDPARLHQTLDKFRSATFEQNEDASIKTYLSDNHGLLLKFGQSSKIIRLKEIERFESMGNYVTVYTNNDKSYIHSSLTKVEKRLDPNTFFKVSRSHIIRIDCIKHIDDGLATGSLTATLHSGYEIEVSRRQAMALKNKFNIWK